MDIALFAVRKILDNIKVTLFKLKEDEDGKFNVKKFIKAVFIIILVIIIGFVVFNYIYFFIHGQTFVSYFINQLFESINDKISGPLYSP